MENQKNIFSDTEPSPEFRFEIETDEERGRVHMRDGADIWTFTLRDNELTQVWKPARELPAARYAAMCRQAVAILKRMLEKRDVAESGQKEIDFSGE